MILNDEQIYALQNEKHIIEPWDEDMLQPASVDLRLGNSFIKQYGGFITPYKKDMSSTISDLLVSKSFKTEKFDSDMVSLEPHDFILGTTIEKISIPDDVCGRFEGKSSLGRIGLLTHVTAGFVDPGFAGNLTVEIVNLSASTIILTPGMKIGQLCLYKMSAPSKKPYGKCSNHYQNQSSTTAAYFVNGEENEI